MKIGIIGGGQLGMMIAQAAMELGHSCLVLAPSVDAPAFAVCGGAERNIVAKFDDRQALEKLCRECDVVTYEFENIPAKILEPLCEKYNIKQGCKQLLDSQDRLREKDNARKNGFPTQRYEAVDGAESLRAAVEKIGLPAVLKTRTMGYDGKGQAVLRNKAEVEALIAQDGLVNVPTILEEFVDYDYEVSVIMVRDEESTTIFPIGQNIHRNGVLDLCIVPAVEMSETLRTNIELSAQTFMERCGYYGILTIELFVKGANYIFNEMAPRPHNSGHYTIEACNGGSQYSELVRYLTGEPLKGATMRGASAVMKNILGGADMEAAKELAEEAKECGWRGCHVHLYGKSDEQEGRKTAHITFTNTTQEEYQAKWSERFLK
ncbi:MAG: 5-(carboxyamino)imidazole ribonucleotide synthase [Rikenellaceae bacterium]